MSNEEYRDYLFSPERLDPRCEIFFGYTLPMLEVAGEGELFRHVVSYSETLPTQYRDQLTAAGERYPFLILDEVKENGSASNVHRIARRAMVAEGIPATRSFGSYRLDDDDFLSADYFAQMRPYVTDANVGTVVSLTRGVTALYEGGRFYYARDAHYPMHSKGHLEVCRFGEDGNLHKPVSAPHNKSDRFNPVILDGRDFSHVWVRSLGQDTSLYQFGQSEDAMLARIYKDMDQYPVLTDPVDTAFPVLAGKVHASRP